ncbi:MAG: bifunctional riboflavin kinase/FAD synthetase [Nitrospirae bacterium]|nr:MAG: bifunctional riboflavin kinase/FAD synthetase [Nitrospirota bacterium]
MKVVERLQECRGLPFPVVTIGNFDGVHLGHQAVLKLLRERVALHRGTVVVLTFDPHPLRVLTPHVHLRFLSDPEEKLRLLDEAGVDVVVRLPFTRDFASQSPEEFMTAVLSEGLGAKELYVGQTFRFGRERAGTIETLTAAAPRLRLTVRAISPVVINGLPISSTRIRHMVRDGLISEAARLLGRPYRLCGKVIQGEHRGGELGFPTANIVPPEGRVLPADGVYATELQVSGQTLPAVSYIGVRPTFGVGARLIETHLLDEGQDLYDREIAIFFHARLRPDQTFESADLLTQQIAADVARTREILRGLPSRVCST